MALNLHTAILVISILCIHGYHGYVMTVEDDGGLVENSMIQPGSSFSLLCSGAAEKDTVVIYKDQPGAIAPVLISVNNFIVDNTAKTRFTAETISNEAEGTKTTTLRMNADGEGADVTDSGSYGCVAVTSSPTTSIDRGAVEWMQVTVLDWNRELYLYALNKDQVHDPEKYHTELFDQEEYEVQDGAEFYFRCVAVASNPAAHIRVTFNDKDITDQFERSEQIFRPEMEEPPPSDVHAIYNYNVSMTSKYPLKVTRQENMRSFVCNASAGPIEASISVMPFMQFPPEVTCQDASSKHRQGEAKLTCTVRTEPMLQQASFVFNDGAEKITIREGEKIGSMTMRRQKGAHTDEYVYVLTWRNVPEEAFREYVFQGKHTTGDVTDKATLTRIGNLVPLGSTSDSSRPTITLLSLLIAPLSLLHRFF